MRIEVLVPDENPVFYDLNKPRMVVGSDLECDVILTHSDVSRQHLTILKEGEAYFVMDKGSTNGSYLNEERLIPGRRVEFNSFFPVRLGTDVLISLVSDEEGMSTPIEKIEIPIPKAYVEKAKPVREDATRAVSLKELKEAKTEKLVKRRNEIKKSTTVDAKPTKTEKGKKKSKFKITPAHVSALVIILIALYFNNPFEKKVVITKPVEPVAADSEGRLITKTDPEKIQKSVALELSSLLPEVRNGFGVEKCGPSTVAVCEALNFEVKPPWGANESKSGLLIYLEVSRQLEEASQFYKDKKDVGVKELYELAVLLFISQPLKKQLDLTNLKNPQFIFSFYDPKSENPELKAIVVVDPKRLSSFPFIFPRAKLFPILERGLSIQELTQDYYKFLFVETLTPPPVPANAPSI